LYVINNVKVDLIFLSPSEEDEEEEYSTDEEYPQPKQKTKGLVRSEHCVYYVLFD